MKFLILVFCVVYCSISVSETKPHNGEGTFNSPSKDVQPKKNCDLTGGTVPRLSQVICEDSLAALNGRFVRV